MDKNKFPVHFSPATACSSPCGPRDCFNTVKKHSFQLRAQGITLHRIWSFIDCMYVITAHSRFKNIVCLKLAGSNTGTYNYVISAMKSPLFRNGASGKLEVVLIHSPTVLTVNVSSLMLSDSIFEQPGNLLRNSLLRMVRFRPRQVTKM